MALASGRVKIGPFPGQKILLEDAQALLFGGDMYNTYLISENDQLDQFAEYVK